MSEFLKIPTKAKVNVNWKVKQYDYSLEQKNSIIAKISEKYGIPKRHIRVTPIIINNKNEEISITNEVISNIQKPDFQIKLFKNYLKENEIKDYDFETILAIDSEINGKIDYKVYDNFCRYSINWVKWDNFLSYGQDNYFDFRELKNLVLLTGKPGNTSGKTTFAIELIHFLLFGKTNKAKTLSNVFNNKLNEVTEVCVEGSLTIEGEEYIIRRVLTRPDAKKRTKKSKVTQKVSYYKVIGDAVEELEDTDNLMGETNIKTNQAIKKVIGDESDFDLIICATSQNLNALVSKTEGERGKLFTKWIGLLPIQEKNDIARKLFNELKTTFKSNLYNREELLSKNKTNEANIKTIEEFVEKLKKENTVISDEIKKFQETITVLMEQKNKVDEKLLTIDENTLNEQRKRFISETEKANEAIKKGTEFIKSLNYNEERNTSEINADWENFSKERNDLYQKQGELRATYKIHNEELNKFKENGKICPTCHRPYTDDEYNSYITKQKEILSNIITEGKEINTRIQYIEKEIEKITNYRENQSKYFQATIKIGSYEKKIEDFKKKISEIDETQKAYMTNKKAIDDNNKLTLQINTIKVQIESKTNTINQNTYTIAYRQNEINSLKKENELNLQIIEEIKKEEKLIYNWNIYLDMVGKNGITKMVLRKTLPIINANLATLLNEVCDFSLEVQMNEKNEVVFSMVRDGVKSDLSTCGSGYEETVASLALRAVLAKISTLPRLNFLLLDEIFATIAKENLNKIENFLKKLLNDYDFILIISHMEEISNWFEKIIVVNKEKNISRITTEKK